MKWQNVQKLKMQTCTWWGVSGVKCASPGEDRRHDRNSSEGGSLACHVRSATICRSWHLGHLAVRTSESRDLDRTPGQNQYGGGVAVRASELGHSLSDCGPTQPVARSVIHQNCHSLSYSSLSTHPEADTGEDRGYIPAGFCKCSWSTDFFAHSERSDLRLPSSATDKFWIRRCIGLFAQYDFVSTGAQLGTIYSSLFTTFTTLKFCSKLASRWNSWMVMMMMIITEYGSTSKQNKNRTDEKEEPWQKRSTFELWWLSAR